MEVEKEEIKRDLVEEKIEEIATQEETGMEVVNENTTTQQEEAKVEETKEVAKEGSGKEIIVNENENGEPKNSTDKIEEIV